MSTPAALVERYDNDHDHFAHVLDHLFVPAIEKAGLKPISPFTAGSAVIHAEIIRQITDAHLVLCDMSTLNANVFFELGVRTALDRPVCLVVDNATGVSPFDLTLVNHHKYNPSLTPWVLKDEIPRLQEHIKATLATGEHNAMWRIVSLTKTAEVRGGATDPTTARIELLEYQLRLLASSVSGVSGHSGGGPSAPGTLLGKRILWVDDVPDNNLLETRSLETLGASVTSVRSTKEATELLRPAKEAKQVSGRPGFDLILSDIHRVEDGESRPRAGFELLEKLREDRGVYTPIIFYTTNAISVRQEPMARKYRTPVADSPDELLELITRELA